MLCVKNTTFSIGSSVALLCVSVLVVHDRQQGLFCRNLQDTHGATKEFVRHADVSLTSRDQAVECCNASH